MSKVKLWIGLPFMLFGLVFAGIGGWFYWSDRELANSGTHTQGTVVDLQSSRNSDGDMTYKPVVEFSDRNGTRFQFVERIASSPPSFSRGEKVDLIYDPEDPENAMIDSFTTRYLFPLVFGGFGLLAALIGGWLMLSFVRRRRVIAELKQTGLRIQASFTQCYLDTSVKINGRSPYRVAVQATHPATGRLTSFTSDPIWLDLSEVLKDRDVPVIVDPQDPDDYYVDLSEWVDTDEQT